MSEGVRREGGRGERSKLGVCNKFWLSERGERSRGAPCPPLEETTYNVYSMYMYIYTMYGICTHQRFPVIRKLSGSVDYVMPLPVLLVTTATEW